MIIWYSTAPLRCIITYVVIRFFHTIFLSCLLYTYHWSWLKLFLRKSLFIAFCTWEIYMKLFIF